MTRARAALYGHDHHALGEIAVEVPAPGVAIAISRGESPKRYPYVDPNEDAVAAVVGDDAIALVCADGHGGEASSHVAVAQLLELLGEKPPPVLSDDELLDLFAAANAAVLEATGAHSPMVQASRTTLALAVIAPDQLTWAAFGDGDQLVGNAAGVRFLGQRRSSFVGYPMQRGSLERLLARGVEPLAADDWTVLITDGLSEFLEQTRVEDVLAELLADDPRAEDLAAALVRRAFEAGAGDNVGVAVVKPR